MFFALIFLVSGFAALLMLDFGTAYQLRGMSKEWAVCYKLAVICLVLTFVSLAGLIEETLRRRPRPARLDRPNRH